MSEKAACPRCDSYVSEVYYEGHHEWCGWNCHVTYQIDAYGPSGSVELSTSVRPDADLRASVARLVGADDTSVTVLVDGYPPRHPSAWFDLDQDPPKAISERKRKANLKALRERRVENAMHAIDADLGV